MRYFMPMVGLLMMACAAAPSDEYTCERAVVGPAYPVCPLADESHPETEALWSSCDPGPRWSILSDGTCGVTMAIEGVCTEPGAPLLCPDGSPHRCGWTAVPTFDQCQAMLAMCPTGTSCRFDPTDFS